MFASKDRSCVDCVYSGNKEYLYCKLQGFDMDLFHVIHDTTVCLVYF